MIFDRVENAQQYACLSPAFKTAMDAVQNYDPAGFEKGCKITLDNGVFLNQFEYDTKAPENAKMEAHRHYADVMLMAQGGETICCKPTAELTEITMEYAEDKDALLAVNDADAIQIPMTAGHFVVFLPQDAHAPGCILEQIQTVRRVVIKVPLD